MTSAPRSLRFRRMGVAAALALFLSPIAAACSTSGDSDADDETTTTEASSTTTSEDEETTTTEDDGGDETTTTESTEPDGDSVDAFIEGASEALLENPTLDMDRSQAECTAAAWADTLGPDQITDMSFNPEAFTRGDKELAGEIVDGMTDCGLDLDQMMYDELTTNQGLTDSQATCVIGELPPGSLREVIALEMSGELQGDDDPITDVFFNAGLACAEA